MIRALFAAALLSAAPPTVAQVRPHPEETPAPPASGSAPSAATPATAPPSKGPRELEEAKELGRHGLVKLAPRLGGSRAEKLAKDEGGAVVGRAVDLAAEAAGILPKR